MPSRGMVAGAVFGRRAANSSGVDTGAESASDPPASRWTWRRWSIIFCVLLALGAVIASIAVVRSPETAEQRKPNRTVLSAPVERRALVSSVVTRGTVSPIGDTPVSCMPVSAGSDVTVFTKPATEGASLREGDLLAAVNGRPVLVLRGKTAAFRTMRPGVSGVDVQQLQSGLKRLGYRISDKKGVLGASTQRALMRWYAAAGFSVIGPTIEESAALRSARDALSQADAQVQSATGALRDLRAGPSRSELLSSRVAVDQAREQVRKAATADGRRLALRELEIARARDRELRKGPDLTAAKAAVRSATAARLSAKQDLATATAATGVSVPYCEVIFLRKLPVTVTKTGASNNSGDDPTTSPTDVWAKLAPGKLLVRSELTESDATLVQMGAPVTFRADGATEDLHGTVTAMNDDHGQATVEVTPKVAFDHADQGANLRVSITVGSTAGEVLVVPLAAVSGTASGLARVQKVTPAGMSEIVVRAGLVADGYVEIAAVQGGALGVGDEVVVGQ
ncbi:hypothetical protein [Micropruina sp.]|uniref:hypothetical protein n=1 Tax=Micropruina sp. TaxID=2737536 RepID=UPI0039E67B12